MKPEDVGVQKSNRVLGKHSGRHALVAKVNDLGLELDDGQIDKLFVAFKELADKQKDISNEDIRSLVKVG